MRLNADIVFAGLPDSLAPHMHGEAQKRLMLQSPEFWEAESHELQDNHLYVLRKETLPQRVAIGQGCVLVCIGNSPRLRWFSERCCVIAVRSDADIFAVFNALQRTYARFGLWEETLYNLAETADVQAMLEATHHVIRTPMIVVDAGFTCVAHVGEIAGSGIQGQPDSHAQANHELALDKLDRFLAEHDLSMDVRGAFNLDVQELTTLNVNLIDDDGYHGCLTLIYSQGAPRRGDDALAEFLASMILRAMAHTPQDGESRRGNLRSSLAALVNNQALDSVDRTAVQAAGAAGSYVCVRLRLEHRLNQFPLPYVRNTLETSIPGTVAFEYHRSSVVAFVRIDDLAPEGERRHQLEQTLLPLLTATEMRAGMSDHVTSLLDCRSYFLQASIALENGSLLSPQERLYRFQDYALVEMIVNSTGEMPDEMFFTSGLRRLFAHDQTSPVSYVDTLRCFLKLGMNVTHTAEALYVHRSTMIERLARIRELLGEDLDDPDVRLRLEMVLKGLELREQLRARLGDDTDNE